MHLEWSLSPGGLTISFGTLALEADDRWDQRSHSRPYPSSFRSKEGPPEILYLILIRQFNTTFHPILSAKSYACQESAERHPCWTGETQKAGEVLRQ